LREAVPDSFEQMLALLFEGSCCHSWVNGGWEGRAGGKTYYFEGGRLLLVTMVVLRTVNP
jgi:hypothetical protein